MATERFFKEGQKQSRKPDGARRNALQKNKAK